MIMKMINTALCVGITRLFHILTQNVVVSVTRGIEMTDWADDTTVIKCKKCGVKYVKKRWIVPDAHPCSKDENLQREYNKFVGYEESK